MALSIPSRMDRPRFDSRFGAWKGRVGWLPPENFDQDYTARIGAGEWDIRACSSGSSLGFEYRAHIRVMT